MPTFKQESTGKRFFFAHIPRTAGRFIEYNLICVEKNDCRWDPDEQFKMDNGLGIMSVMHGAEVAHYHKELYEEYLDVKDIPHFSIIRNPIDRFISGSMYIKRKYGDDIQELMEDRRKADEAEQKRITEEMEALDKAKALEEVKNKKKIEWKDPR